MKQKMLLSSAFVFFCACLFVQAQDKTVLSAYYTLQEKGQNEHDWYHYVLDISETASHFQDQYEYENKLMNDSICKARGIQPHPESYTFYILQKGFHPRYSRLHVLKNAQAASLILADGVVSQGVTKLYYEEPMPEYDWEMLNGDTIIGGYACQKARMTYRGHSWTAWFSSEIAVSDGPWKLCGLPGLILDARDSEGEFHFVLTALKNNTGRDVAFSVDGWKKTTAGKLYKLYLQKEKRETAWLARAVEDMPAGRKMEAPPYHYLERFDK